MSGDSFVRRMFKDIAFSYDFQNSFLSLRRDISWRRTLADSVRTESEPLVLDAATGTAEVAIEICRRKPKSRVVGVDFSLQMLAIGKRKVQAMGLGDRICLVLGDGRVLPLKDETVDAVTIAFGIRNIEERHEALAEFRRVLRPGGQLLVMEFGYPDDPVLEVLYRFYFHYILPPLGNRISRTDYAYSYLVGSVKAFPAPETFLKELAAAGFVRLGLKKLTYGVARIFSGIKNEGSGSSPVPLPSGGP